MNAGDDVFSEKPLALISRLDNAQMELLQAKAAIGSELVVSHNRLMSIQPVLETRETIKVIDHSDGSVAGAGRYIHIDPKRAKWLIAELTRIFGA